MTLDGVPENLAFGAFAGRHAGGVAGVVALLIAIFVSNFPESLVGAVAMRSADRSQTFVIAIWTVTAIGLTGAVVVNRGIAEGIGRGTLAFRARLRWPAVLASLADTSMPETFEHGRPFNAVATALGFLLAFVLSDL